MKYFSITQAISYAFRSYFKNWSFFGTIFIVILLIIMGIDFFIMNFKSNVRFSDFFYDFSLVNLYTKMILGTILCIVIFFYLFLLNKLFLENYDDNFFSLNKFFSIGPRKIGSYLATSFLYYLISVAFYATPILIMHHDIIYGETVFGHFLMVTVGFLILIFPAIIISSRYMFADYFEWEKDATIIQNFTECPDHVCGQTRKLVILFYILGICSILFCIPITVMLWGLSLVPAFTFFQITGFFYWPEYVFSIFYIFGFIIPILFLIKVSIYKQLFRANSVVN